MAETVKNQGAAAADCCRSDSESREEVHIDNGEEEGKKAKGQGDPVRPRARLRHRNLWPCS